jgi:hypothetical protein
MIIYLDNNHGRNGCASFILLQNSYAIDLDGTWTGPFAGKLFLVCDDTDARGHRILIFASDDSLRHLCESPLILGDGTFQFTPALDSQLYSWHEHIEAIVFPFVFAFLPNKTDQM